MTKVRQEKLLGTFVRHVNPSVSHFIKFEISVRSRQVQMYVYISDR